MSKRKSTTTPALGVPQATTLATGTLPIADITQQEVRFAAASILPVTVTLPDAGETGRVYVSVPADASDPRLLVKPDESEAWTVVKSTPNADTGQTTFDIAGPRGLTARACVSRARAWVKFSHPRGVTAAASEACRLAAEAFAYRAEDPGSDVSVDLRDVSRLGEVVLGGEDGTATAVVYFGI
jgi:hypothetical protein